MVVLLGVAMLGQVACASVSMCDSAPEDVEPALVTEAEDAPQEVTPEDVCGMPVCGPLGRRLYCIEGYESGHFGGALNRRSGAAGWLQWLPGTARQWGVVIGDRWSEWQAAVRIAAQGERFFRSQWVPLQLGWC